jgi:hypothetical protein
MSALFYLLYYFAALLFGGLVITGWFAVTRGRWETRPDGRKYWTGKIFNEWQRFWERTVASESVYFRERELQGLCLRLESILSIRNYTFSESQTCIIIDAATHSKLKNRFFVFELQNPGIKVMFKEGSQGDEGKHYAFFYKDLPIYAFPEWIRDPMASCIYCHSSIYGTIIWSFLAIISNNVLPVGIYVALWIPYILSLAFVSPYLWKKL